ncbi:hypothetical protein NKG94_07195 [Micromonospora sp. M12]
MELGPAGRDRPGGACPTGGVPGRLHPEAAEYVCRTDLDVLARLVDRSLVVLDDSGAAPVTGCSNRWPRSAPSA